MRKTLTQIGLSVIAMLVLLALIAIATTAFGWALPGSWLFPLQEKLEQASIVGTDIKKAERSLSLVERRIDDLNSLIGTSHELDALNALGKSIDQVLQAFANVPEKEKDELFTHLADLLQQAEIALDSLTQLPDTHADTLSNFQDRLWELVDAIESGALQSGISYHQPNLANQAGAIPDGGSQVSVSFPLTGSHRGLECLDCHITGTFTDTNTTCIGCHVDVTPSGNAHHFHAPCDYCHTTNSWQDIIWDHNPQVASDCFSCHEWDVPLNHDEGQCSSCHLTSSWLDQPLYHSQPSACWVCHEGQAPENHYLANCSSCHTTETWSGAEYTPSAITDHLVNADPGHVDVRCSQCHGEMRCSSCHDNNRPIHHYGGQCSNCHVVDGWNQVTFLHTPTADCLSCHSDTAPANHFPGQCSTCHTFDGWPGAIFDHSGITDCISCHASTAPANHFPGQCSNCHLYTTWADVHFSHTSLTDCISCHADTAPPNHYTGQCSLCHNPSGWTNVRFNHTGLTDCISCHAEDAPPDHFIGQCSNCHTPTVWGAVTFNHDGYTDCIGCHAADAPDNHYDLQCSECHTPTVWSDVSFDHIGYTDCISCHEDDRPDDHPQAQCSICHNTSSWSDVDK